MKSLTILIALCFLTSFALVSCKKKTEATLTATTVHVVIHNKALAHDSIVAITPPQALLAWSDANHVTHYVELDTTPHQDTTPHPCPCESTDSYDTLSTGSTSVTHWGCGWSTVTFQTFTMATPGPNTWQINMPGGAAALTPAATSGVIAACTIGDIVPLLEPGNNPMNFVSKTSNTMTSTDYFTYVSMDMLDTLVFTVAQ